MRRRIGFRCVRRSTTSSGCTRRPNLVGPVSGWPLFTASSTGTVAGRGLVVVAHADGVTTEYEPVRLAVTAGTRVRGGQLLGTVHGRHGACAPGACLHWGARRGQEYLDPLLLLAPLGPVRLLPWTVP